MNENKIFFFNANVNNFSSCHRGVTFDRKANKYKAQIGVSGHRLHLGYFDDQDDAGKAYDKTARVHHAKPKLNFPRKRRAA